MSYQPSPIFVAPAGPPPMSAYEQHQYYLGVAPGYNHPHLLYRSDSLERPFPRPKGRFQDVFVKTAYPIANGPLKKAWPIVDTRIRDIVVKRWGIRYTTITLARFLTEAMEAGGGSFGPDVIWICVLPRVVISGPSLESDDDAARSLVHKASLDMISLLAEEGIHDVAIEWVKGRSQRYRGLLPSVNRINATYHVRRFLTASLGIPISVDTKKVDGASGTLGVIFCENQDSEGNPSNRVLASTACHVVSEDEDVTYDASREAGKPRLTVRASGESRFQQGLDDIDRAITEHQFKAKSYRCALASLGPNASSEDAAKDLARLQRGLDREEEAVAVLQAFRHEVAVGWGDIEARTIGRVEWAPAIGIDAVTKYTKDLATIELDADAFRDAFDGNVVSLGEFDSWRMSSQTQNSR
jgi:hypothetical protein